MTKSRFNPTFIAAQTQKNEVLARIEEDYPITRRNGNNCSRGLERGNLECYRLAVLQCLLHQPKALRWLLTHDIVETDDEGNFLRTVNPYVNQRRNPATGERIHSSVLFPDCMVCAIKIIIKLYWGDRGMHHASGHPQALPPDCSTMHHIHRLSDANAMFEAGQQADPEEYLLWVLQEY
jgi:hypothetical protein